MKSSPLTLPTPARPRTVQTVLGLVGAVCFSATLCAQSEVRPGQALPLSPEASLRSIQLDGPYEAQLVAAEPLVLDPVECAWDARGRLFVADMRDYPLGPKNVGDPWLSCIQLLLDTDGDGRMDKAVPFAENLDHVQGLLPYKDGLIVTTRTQILFLRDTDGDDRADEIRPLVEGFNPRFSQLQVSAPRWGPDGCVYFNNGLDGKEIYASAEPGVTVGIPRSNFKWDPASGKLAPVTGYGQYGAAFDDFGHYFFCTNRNPVLYAVMPAEAVARNPAAGIEKGFEDIAPFGPDTRVYPLQVTHTTSDAHAGTNTACSGVGVYRGHLMPELRNDVFVPEPTGQLVTRYRVAPNGAGLKAVRVGERTEFFRSSDQWCRPVNLTTGPDGALYICDIYRRWIDHSRFFPEEFVKTHDMREGEQHGRIWRIVPKGAKVAAAEGAPPDEAGLRKWLAHPNAWQRETAARLLAEKGSPRINTAIEDPNPARRTFLALLARPDSADSAPAPAAVQERVAALLAAPEDPWIARAVLASSARSCGSVLAGVLSGGGGFTERYSAGKAQMVQGLARACAASGVEGDFLVGVRAVLSDAGRLSWWKAAMLHGLGEGLPKAPGSPWGRSLVEFQTRAPVALGEAAREVGALSERAAAAVADAGAPEELRLSCLALLGGRKWEENEPVLRALFVQEHSPALQAAALAQLRGRGAEKTAAFVYELLPKAGPGLRRELVALLAAGPKTALELFQRMDRGELPAALVEVETRWRYQQGTGELRDLAVKLFGQPSKDREAVVAAYADALTLEGNADRGGQLFSTLCVSCHRHGGAGMDVGPSLSDVRVKPPEALLSDILDPNRMFDARFSAYQVELKDGRALVGLVSSENASSITLTLVGGVKETLSRSSIRDMKSMDRSLMPVGLEGAINKQQMADLLAFLRRS